LTFRRDVFSTTSVSSALFERQWSFVKWTDLFFSPAKSPNALQCDLASALLMLQCVIKYLITADGLNQLARQLFWVNVFSLFKGCHLSIKPARESAKIQSL